MKAKLDTEEYKKGRKISDEQMDRLNIRYHKVNPQWNYTIKPNKQQKTSKHK